ncbi:hypothetical protein ACJ73_03111 [Blastomyces percursus]|uniref:Uncharacterized protein n=1 Tax=Blastomyces percursus TaxID=1658174 RepID=A0A1J9Q9M7_9EURO|nr:hypothetical protein ACJ73_03111 [Blastomyces percursus]
MGTAEPQSLRGNERRDFNGQAFEAFFELPNLVGIAEKRMALSIPHIDLRTLAAVRQRHAKTLARYSTSLRLSIGNPRSRPGPNLGIGQLPEGIQKALTRERKCLIRLYNAHIQEKTAALGGGGGAVGTGIRSSAPSTE